MDVSNNNYPSVGGDERPFKADMKHQLHGDRPRMGRKWRCKSDNTELERGAMPRTAQPPARPVACRVAYEQ